ncbi:unnamed protein product [Thelazia callipaeda]|uniref:Sushi domain-containing protein n=1 Tax=Thelazia callipaeda TaxID=103827 RepID=A0A158RD45_THECL|nr:unnamed protein product [Thelazia callipaeda]
MHSKIYRIGSHQLKQEYSSNLDSDEIFLNSGIPTACPIHCTLKLSTNLRSTDDTGMVLHQENVGSTPAGYVDVSGPQGYYCARSVGDCGAFAPIYRHKNETQLMSRYAYSFRADSLFEGYVRELNPICYGWKDDSKTVNEDFTLTNSIFSNSTDCGPIPPVPNGKLIYKPASSTLFAMGSVATLSCNDGFKPSINSKIVCITGSWYPMEMLDGCSPLPAHENGHILYSQHGTNTFPSGTLAYLICNGHYRSISTRQARCVRGQWSTRELGTCQLITKTTCPTLSTSQNGEVKYVMGSKDNITLGTVAELECYPEYIIDGVDALICEPSGWTPAQNLGTCVKGTRPCPPALPLVLNGQISFSNEPNTLGTYVSGTVAVVRCNTGYTINGAFLSTCEDSMWQPPNLGTCVAVPGIVPVRNGNPCPFMLRTPLAGMITYSRGGTFGSFPSGTTATLDCIQGFPEGPTLAVCDNGSWIPHEMGTCSPLILQNALSTTNSVSANLNSCLSDYPSPSNGIVVYSNGAVRPPYPPLVRANIRCSPGYIPTGTALAICQNGTWIPEVPTKCIQSKKTTGSGAHGTVLSPFVTSLEVTPLAGGVLDLPCSASLVTPVNGYVTYSTGSTFGPFPTGTVGKLTCQAGFIPAGVTSSTCLSGIWSPPMNGQCILPSSRILGAPLGSTTGILGLPCAPLVPPVNGQISYSNGLELGPFPSGTIATVFCNPDYTTVGTTTAACTDGTFIPPVLTQCLAASLIGLGEMPCAPLPEPPNGVLTYSGVAGAIYNSGSTATLICNLGFIPSGPTETICKNGQWIPTLGYCQQSIFGLSTGLLSATTQCLFELPVVANGRIQYSTGSVLAPYDSGTTASLICNFGSTPIGATLSVCTNGVWNPPVLGQCPLNGR